MKYDHILFDLDGTLTDPGEGITNSVMYALSKWDIHVADRRELYRFIGPPLLDSFSRICGFSEEDSRRAVGYYREYFADRGIFENTMYDGIGDMLSHLKDAGKKVILATSKPERFAVEILGHFGIDKYFDAVAGSDMEGTRSAKCDVIEYALTLCGRPDRSRVLMVGDREHDVMGAHQCGIACAGVLYGYGSREELISAGAEYVAGSVGELEGLLIGD